MKVIEKINEATEKGRVVFSFEFFPPKTGHGTTNLLGKMNSMVVHDPCFCAMSMDSSGSSADLTIYNANEMHNQVSVETMMHITCINMLVEKIDRALDSIKSNGIQNVLALGDPPRSQVQGGFLGGIDLVEHIRTKYGDYFGVTVVGYPEAHFDVIRSNGEGTLEGCENDLMYLKRKVDVGADLIIAPLFYDTNIFLKFVDDCRRIGITCPIIPGIMPINNYNDFMHITKLSKIKLPSEIAAAIEPIKDNEKAVRNYGIHLGTEICKKILAHGIKALHFYTLNFEKPTMAILQNLGLIDKGKIRPLPHRCVRDVQPNSQAKRKRHISARFKSKRPSYGTSTDCQLSTSKQSDTQAIPGIMEDSSALELPPSQPMNREVLTELPASRLPWLMLADDPNSAATHTFFSLVDSKIYEIELPMVKGKRCVGSSEGWLITIDSNLEIGLLNPFSRVQIQLPPQPTFEYQYHVGFRSTTEYRRDWYIHKAFVSNPLTDDCVALAIHYLRRNLAFCRPGSTAWTTIASMDMNPFEDAIFYQGKFYAISQRVKLVVCDLGSVPRAIEVVSGPRHLLCWIKYLVNASDTLLMVARKRRVIDGKYATLEFEVYILVPDSGGGVKWKLVKNLRSLALFIGGNSTICLSVDEYPECKRNCIYFTDDYCDAYRIHKDGKGSDMGVYNYGDGTFEPVYPGVSRSRLWPPVWVKPN